MGERNNNIEYEYEYECGMEMKTVEVDVDVDSFRFFPDRRVTLRYGTVQSSVDCLSFRFAFVCVCVCVRVPGRGPGFRCVFAIASVGGVVSIEAGREYKGGGRRSAQERGMKEK